MKRAISLVTGLIGLTLPHAFAGEAPRGSLLELHSCEVYAGGCVVSSEATQGGRYMLRAWNFSAGDFNGTDFKGLQLAVLQASPDNLAAPDSQSGDAVIYLPQTSTANQREALLAWLKSSQTDFHPGKFQTRAVSMQFTKSDKGYAFSAGDRISVKTDSLESCPIGGCGEALWYQPRSATSLFTVEVNRASHVAEPLLKLKWDDSGRRTVFLANFGQTTPVRNLYVSLSELCGSARALF